MATPGKIVVTDSGKRGLRSATGKAAVFNSNGKCAECCEFPCPFCEGITPKTYEIAFSGITWCCRNRYDGTGEKYDDDLGNLALVALVQEPNYPCTWSAFVPLRLTRYYGNLCQGDLIDSTWVDVQVELRKTSNTEWVLDIFEQGWSWKVFGCELADQAPDCTGNLMFTNAITACIPGEANPAAYGGSASLNVP